MSRTARFLGGLQSTYLTQIVTTAVGLWLTPFLLHHIGEHDYGLWLLTTQVTAYLLLLDLGVVALLPREVALATGGAAPGAPAAGVEELLSRTSRIVLRQWPLVAVAAVAAWLLVPAEWAALQAPLAVLLATFVVLFPLRLVQGTLIGLQDLRFVGGVTLASWTLQTVVNVAGVLLGHGIWALVAGWCVAQVATSVATWTRLRMKHGLRVRPFGGSTQPLGPMFRKSLWVSASQVASVLIAGTDLLVIGKLLGPAAIVPYSMTGKLVSVLANQPHVIVHAALPALAQMRAEQAGPRLLSVIAALCLAMLVGSGAVVCVVLAMNEGFVRWWVGDEHWAGALLSALLLTLMLVRHWSTTYAYTLFTFGHERLLAILALAEGVIGVALMVGAVRWMGAVGAPIGALLGIVLVTLPITVKRLAVALDVPVTRVLAPLAPWAIRFVLAAAASFALSRIYVPTHVVEILLTGAVVGIAYALIMMPVMMRSTLRPYIDAHVPPRALRLLGALGAR